MNRLYIRRNINAYSILIFISLFSIIQYIQPSFLYNSNGSFKVFGLGRKKKTIIPIWLITFVLAIFSYLFILYYLTYPKF